MSRRSKRTTTIPSKLRDYVYTLTSKKNKQKHDVMDTDNECFSEECGEDCSGNNEKCDVTKEDCGVTEEQGKEVENDQDKDDWSVKLGDRNDVDITQQSIDRSEMHNEDGKGKHEADSIMNRKVSANCDANIGTSLFDNLFENKLGKDSMDKSVKNDNINVFLYAKMVNNDTNALDKSLFFVHASMNDNGEEAVIFDEELVEEGCQKWKNTVCGFFVGCSMSIYEMRYNLRRIWGRHGLGESIVDTNEICFFKFKNTKASWLGRPIMIDDVTATMCHKGIGSTGYARILVEIHAKKGFLDQIEVIFKDALKNTKRIKHVKVKYVWKPDIYDHCRVFGHKERPKVVENSGNLQNKDKSNNVEVDKNVSEVRNNKKEKIEKDKKELDKEDTGDDRCKDARLNVDRYVLRKVQSTLEETKNWTYDMRQYFKYRWHALNRNDENNEDTDDILDENNATADLVADDIGGSDN
ncbi:hypothetical protein Tco_0616508 [Tanacetum coccineum]